MQYLVFNLRYRTIQIELELGKVRNSVVFSRILNQIPETTLYPELKYGIFRTEVRLYLQNLVRKKSLLAQCSFFVYNFQAIK